MSVTTLHTRLVRLSKGSEANVRVLIDELATVVDLIVDHKEEVLLGVVLGNILVGVFLSLGHGDGVV